MEQAKFTYSPLGKALEKQTKTIEDQGIKQAEALKALKPQKNKGDIKSIEGIFLKEMRTNKIKNEIHEIKKWEKKIKWENLKLKAKKYTHEFQKCETIRSFGDNIHTDKINADEVEMDQINLLKRYIKI